MNAKTEKSGRGPKNGHRYSNVCEPEFAVAGGTLHVVDRRFFQLLKMDHI